MSVGPAATGADTTGIFLWEDDASGNIDFATDSPDDSDYKTFGDDVSVTDAEMDNDPVNLFDPGSREAAKRVAQMFSGTWGVQFVLSAPWFWKAVVDEASTSGASPPYTHTFSGEVPWPMRLVLGNQATGNERILKGCVVTDCTLDVADNGTVNVSLSGAYADEEETSPGVGSIQSQVSSGFDPLMFADGGLTFGGTSYNLAQNVSITISNNIEMVTGLGSRFAQTYAPLVRTTTIDWGTIVEDDSTMTETYGGTGSTSPQDRVDSDDEFSATITFDNDASSGASDQNSQTINLSGTFPDTYGRSGTGDPSSLYIGNVSYTSRVIDDVTATNATETAK